MKRINAIIVLFTVLLLVSCEDYLKENPPGELSPANFLATQKGVEAVLNSAYANYNFSYGYHEGVAAPYEYPCDILYQTGGGMNLNFVIQSQFQWTSSTAFASSSVWGSKYASIRDANTVIDNINNIKDEAVRKVLLAEARYIRAVDYVYLYDSYGAVPLRKSSYDATDLARATDEEMTTFIVAELEAAALDLPNPGSEAKFGRATKGAALSFLTRYYMIKKDWTKAAETAKRVMDLGYYQLFASYHDLFKVDNEHDKNANNKEMIAVAVNTNTEPYGNMISACAMPTGFSYTTKIPEFKAVGIANWASQFRLYDAFVNSFDKVKDTRYSLIFDTYVNASGQTVDLKTLANNQRTLKFFDNKAVGASHGNDFPLMRYADILLMRAEALNELNGPNAEAVGLINQVRNRAGLDNLNAADFSKETLRDQILKERGWEFYYEGLRRSDLIRHGKFISSAKARGVTTASDFHVLYPIPQAEMDANDNMVQNPGYK
jgi:hypothetical protein